MRSVGRYRLRWESKTEVPINIVLRRRTERPKTTSRRDKTQERDRIVR